MVTALTARPAVVLGASSQIGWFAVPRLVASGFRVVSVSRKGRPDGYPALSRVEWIQAEALREAAADAAALLSAGPLQLALDVLDILPSLERLVAFSTTSVLSKVDSPDPVERKLVKDIIHAERQLQTRCQARGVELCLLRPTLVYGCGMDANVSRIARLIGNLPWFPVAGAASGLRQPVHADDLAAAAVAAMTIDNALPSELSLCGGSTLTYREMLEKIALAIGRRLRPIRLPEGMLSLALQALRPLPAFRDLSPAMIRRQNLDLVFDDSPARDLLRYRPRRFEPEREDLDRPDPARILALAKSAAEGGD